VARPVEEYHLLCIAFSGQRSKKQQHTTKTSDGYRLNNYKKTPNVFSHFFILCF
jgi:hypothetical protein